MMISRRKVLSTMGTGVALLGLSTSFVNAAAGKSGMKGSRPNILFIFSDDHALRTIGAYDGSVNKTPNIDRIAKEGAIFDRSYCANSICQPSRACILTGKHSHKNGIRDNGDRWNRDQLVFTRLLKSSGYQSALIGKWHMHPNPSNEFDYWKVLSGAGGQGYYYNPTFVSVEGEEQIEGYSTDVITDQTIEWLDTKRDPDKPFLMMCQFKAPHVHRIPAPRFMNLYEDEEIAEPETLFDNYENRNPHAKTAWMMVDGMSEGILNILPPEPNAEEPRKKNKRQKKNFLERMTAEQQKAWHDAYDSRNKEYFKLKREGKMTGKAKMKYFYQRYIKDYIRCVAAIDDNVGRLLGWLEKSGLAENTIIIYSSDQGYYTGEHGWAEKRWMYEESLRMPFIIRWPSKIKPGQRINSMIQNIDYAPTFLEVAGVKVPEEMDGRSMVPLLEGKEPKDWRKSIYYHYYAHGKHNVPRHYGVRSERYKLIHYYTDDVWELFDLEKDPNEMMNLYTNPEYKSIVQKMKLDLKNLRTQYAVPPNKF